MSAQEGNKVQMTLEQIKTLRDHIRPDESLRVSAYIDVITQWAQAANAELAALRAELQKVRSAAISGMDAATQHGHSLVQQAARLKAESNPDALESERAANALLTEQLQKAEADLAALRAERDALRAALIEATEMVEHWGGYASDYFQKKWNLEGDLTKLRAAIAAESQS